jgi:hypothetical protein
VDTIGACPRSEVIPIPLCRLCFRECPLGRPTMIIADVGILSTRGWVVKFAAWPWLSRLVYLSCPAHSFADQAINHCSERSSSHVLHHESAGDVQSILREPCVLLRERRRTAGEDGVRLGPRASAISLCSVCGRSGQVGCSRGIGYGYDTSVQGGRAYSGSIFAGRGL